MRRIKMNSSLPGNRVTVRWNTATGPMEKDFPEGVEDTITEAHFDMLSEQHPGTFEELPKAESNGGSGSKARKNPT